MHSNFNPELFVPTPNIALTTFPLCVFSWIQACINEDLPHTTEMEEGLRNGVYLAKLGHFFAPSVVPLRKIYDKDQTRYNVCIVY